MSADVAADLRRRRAASYRLQPLEDGRRDPMDLKRRAHAKRVIAITINRDRNVALVKGWGARQLILDAGHKPLWSATGRGWCIDSKYAPDVEAVAQLERRIVTVREVGGGDAG